MENVKISRRAERECALKLLYAYDVGKGADNLTAFFEDTCANAEIPHGDHAKEIFTGVVAQLPEIDEKIEKYSHGWKMGRIAKVSKAILRICVYELLYRDDVPDEVAINEAVELAKTYDTDKAPAFVNGILNSVLKEKNQ